jgi:glucosamine 6-phosphate synthetase-like amidotransferase/phosphosugar isomerase protein
MCGIFGWIKPKGKKHQELDLVEIFKRGLIESMERGEDATGFYASNIGLVKLAEDAEEFVDGNVPKSLAEANFVIGHCRMASAKYAHDDANLNNDENAQPFESTHFVTAHNGTINIPKLKGYAYTSDIDSESIIAYAEKTSLRNALATIDGGSTVVAYDKRKKCMYFWTNGDRPLAVCLFGGIIFFASTRKILQRTLKPKTEINIFTPEIAFATIYEDELLEYDFNKNKFTRKGEIEAKVSPEARASVKSHIVSEHFQPIKQNKPLPRGSGSNPTPPNSGLKANGTTRSDLVPVSVLRSSTNMQSSFADQLNDQIESITSPDVRKQVRIGPNGARIITYVTKGK